jgi:autotransporter-associated beta strand protein
VTKTGAGKLTISSGSVVTNSVTNIVANSYTGPTTVNAGTLQLGGSHASSITIGASAVLESTLTTNSPATAGSLNFVSGAKVRIAGTASQSSYTLVTASNGIVGLPTLETAVPDYALSVSNNSLLLVATSAPLSPYGSWLTNYPSLTGSNTNGTADPDGDGFNNNMEFAFDGNPTVGSPAMISVVSSGASSVFSFLASTNTAAVSYMVQSTTNLATGPWGDNSGVTATITNSANQANVPLYPSYLRREFRVTPTGTNSFYRVKATISQ